jgi:hypothetical protein
MCVYLLVDCKSLLFLLVFFYFSVNEFSQEKKKFNADVLSLLLLRHYFFIKILFVYNLFVNKNLEKYALVV